MAVLNWSVAHCEATAASNHRTVPVHPTELIVVLLLVREPLTAEVPLVPVPAAEAMTVEVLPIHSHAAVQVADAEALESSDVAVDVAPDVVLDVVVDAVYAVDAADAVEGVHVAVGDEPDAERDDPVNHAVALDLEQQPQKLADASHVEVEQDRPDWELPNDDSVAVDEEVHVGHAVHVPLTLPVAVHYALSLALPFVGRDDVAVVIRYAMDHEHHDDDEQTPS